MDLDLAKTFVTEHERGVRGVDFDLCAAYRTLAKDARERRDSYSAEKFGLKHLELILVVSRVEGVSAKKIAEAYLFAGELVSNARYALELLRNADETFSGLGNNARRAFDIAFSWGRTRIYIGGRVESSREALDFLLDGVNLVECADARHRELVGIGKLEPNQKFNEAAVRNLMFAYASLAPLLESEHHDAELAMDYALTAEKIASGFWGRNEMGRTMLGCYSKLLEFVIGRGGDTARADRLAEVRAEFQRQMSKYNSKA